MAAKQCPKAGALIAESRARLGLSNRDLNAVMYERLAPFLSSRGLIRHYLNGYLVPRPEVAGLIASYFGLTVHDIWGGAVEARAQSTSPSGVPMPSRFIQVRDLSNGLVSITAKLRLPPERAEQVYMALMEIGVDGQSASVYNSEHRAH